MPEVIVDPELPAKVRRRLESASPGTLIRFSAPSARKARLRRPSMRTRSLTVRISLTTSAALYFISGFQNTPGTIQYSVDAIAFWTFILTLVTALVLRIPIRKTPSREAARAAASAAAAAACHRRYIVPEADLDRECLALWQREITAARQIAGSTVVRQGIIDSVPVSTVLPYHLWEVAERLAILSGPQREQRRILRDLDTRDPAVRAVLEPQRQAKQIAITDIATRIDNLSEFAALIARADAAVKREKALRQLTDLNPAYQEVLAGLGGSENQLSVSGQAADELRAVADEAVRRANEAGRSLVIPERLAG